MSEEKKNLEKVAAYNRKIEKKETKYALSILIDGIFLLVNTYVCSGYFASLINGDNSKINRLGMTFLCAGDLLMLVDMIIDGAYLNKLNGMYIDMDRVEALEELKTYSDSNELDSPIKHIAVDEQHSQLVKKSKNRQ